MNNASTKEGAQCRGRDGLCCIPSLHAKAQSQSHNPSVFPVPKQWLCKWMWFLFHDTLIPAAWCLCQTAEDYFRDFFLLLCLEWWEQSVADVELGCWLVVRGRLSPTQELNCGGDSLGQCRLPQLLPEKQQACKEIIFRKNTDLKESSKWHIYI